MRNVLVIFPMTPVRCAMVAMGQLRMLTPWLHILPSDLAKYLTIIALLFTWIIQRDQAGHAFTKQALPMVWDFTEVNPFIGAAGDITVSLGGIAKVVSAIPNGIAGSANQLDATCALDQVKSPLVSKLIPRTTTTLDMLISVTSSIFRLRRALSAVYPQLFSTLLTPKTQELVATPHRHGGDRQKRKSFLRKAWDVPLRRCVVWLVRHIQ